MNCDEEHEGGTPLRPGAKDEEAPRSQTPVEAARRDIRGEFLARGIEIFRLGLSLRGLGQSSASPDEVEAARREFAEHVRSISQQPGKSLQELHLKTQVLCVLMDFDMPEICQDLARSIRDDAGVLCQRHARRGRHEA